MSEQDETPHVFARAGLASASAEVKPEPAGQEPEDNENED